MIEEAIKALVIGIVEGITEWLPISSTGHMIVVDEFVQLNVSPEFLELFLVVIQIGAILAVIILYFSKLNPFSRKKTPAQRRGTWRLWAKVVVGCIPAGIIFVIADDWVTENFYNAVTVAIMLIFYGVIFIILERHNRKKAALLPAVGKHVRDSKTGKVMRPESVMSEAAMPELAASQTDDVYDDDKYGVDKLSAAAQSYEQLSDSENSDPDGIFKINNVDDIDFKTAFKIGLFQMLAIIPGTSRSGSTIIGGMLCGVSRSAAAEFTFFLAIPVMLGWGLIRSLQFFLDGLTMTSIEIMVLIVGIVVAFVTSMIAIRFLMRYIQRNDFSVFGWYRIAVGAVLLIFFGLTGSLFDIQ